MLFQILRFIRVCRRPWFGFELYIAGFLFLFPEPFFYLDTRRFLDNESGLPGGEMEFRDVTGLFLKAAAGNYLLHLFMIIIWKNK